MENGIMILPLIDDTLPLHSKVRSDFTNRYNTIIECTDIKYWPLLIFFINTSVVWYRSHKNFVYSNFRDEEIPDKELQRHIKLLFFIINKYNYLKTTMNFMKGSVVKYLLKSR